MTECFVGIDTSNYTTSAAICTKEGEVVANLKLPLPVKAGECGLRQSDAVFAHVKNLPVLMQGLSKELQGMKPLAVGVSATPRPQEGSYMPCFLSGIAAGVFAGKIKRRQMSARRGWLSATDKCRCSEKYTPLG